MGRSWESASLRRRLHRLGGYERWLRDQISYERVSVVAVQIISAFAEGERVGLVVAGAGDGNGEWLVFERGVLGRVAGGGFNDTEMIREIPGINRRAGFIRLWL